MKWSMIATALPLTNMDSLIPLQLLELFDYVQTLPVAHLASFAAGLCFMYLIEEQKSGAYVISNFADI